MGLTEYLTAESQIIPYMAFPRFLLEMNLPETAKIIYVLLLDRARMSLRKPGWVDEDGQLFVYYSVSDLAKDLKKSEMTIKNNLSALEEADLIFRQRSKPGLPSRTYVKVYVQSDSFLSHRETENFPSEEKNLFHARTGICLLIKTIYQNLITKDSRIPVRPGITTIRGCTSAEKEKVYDSSE